VRRFLLLRAPRSRTMACGFIFNLPQPSIPDGQQESVTVIGNGGEGGI
jgi:hypothetical protein